MSVLAVVVLGAMLGMIAAYALLAVYAERKVAAYIQDRMGPVEVGPWGLFQTAADILKLLQKERIVPAAADKSLFYCAPIIVYAAVFGGFVVVPFAPGFTISPISLGVLYTLAVVSIDVVGILMAGWGSNNKYALFGAFRSVAQIVAYEVPAGLAILAAVLIFGTLDLAEIAAYQSVGQGYQAFWGLFDAGNIGGIFSWTIFRYPHLILAFIIFFVAGLAQCNRAPFDIPEAESELVSGFHVEYSGFGFAVFFLAEYANMLLVSLVGATLFLGGWNTPLPNLWVIDNISNAGSFELLYKGQFAYLTTGSPDSFSGFFWGVFWLLLKALLLVFVMMWIRWTLPRLRADQLMQLCWKVLTPVGLVLILISAIWKTAEIMS
jgi:NADH-quinone oxidoreductase subunit H